VLHRENYDNARIHFPIGLKTGDRRPSNRPGAVNHHAELQDFVDRIAFPRL
jgi:hypothetical protein